MNSANSVAIIIVRLLHPGASTSPSRALFTRYDWNTDLINRFLPQSRIDRSIASHGFVARTPFLSNGATDSFRSRFPPGNWKASIERIPATPPSVRSSTGGWAFPITWKLVSTRASHSFLANFCRVSTEPCQWTSSGHVVLFSFLFFSFFSLGLTSRWNRGGRDLLIFLCNETKEGSIYWIFFFASRN